MEIRDEFVFLMRFTSRVAAKPVTSIIFELHFHAGVPAFFRFSAKRPFPWLYYEEVMPGGMAYVDAVGRYDSVVAPDKVTDIGGNQCVRSPCDRSIDNATVLQIKAWGKSRQIVRIVDRHFGVSKFGIAPPPSTTCGKSPDGPRREIASMRDMNRVAESRLAPFLVRTSNNLDSMAWETTN